MKTLSKLKTNKKLIFVIFAMFLISLISLYATQKSFSMFSMDLVYRQILWYSIGFIVIYVVVFLENDFFSKYVWSLYILGNVSLLALLLFAEPINNASRWFIIPYVGTIQPSEFVKIILILVVSAMVTKFNNSYDKPSPKEELFFLLKVGFFVGIPSVLTFLQPDTGVVIIYLVLTLVILFVGGIRYRWFLGFLALLGGAITFVLSLFFISTDLFIKVLGTDFFLRVDRLLDWGSKTGFQLESGLIAIGNGTFFGSGIGNTPIYFPEAQTDFIFAVYANNFGFLGVLILFLTFGFLYYVLVKIAFNSHNFRNHYIVAGFIGILLYQQLQNIGMTFGLFPLTGITLPFISAGGSSLLSYMIMVGIIVNIANEK